MDENNKAPEEQKLEAALTSNLFLGESWYFDNNDHPSKGGQSFRRLVEAENEGEAHLKLVRYSEGWAAKRRMEDNVDIRFSHAQIFETVK